MPNLGHLFSLTQNIIKELRLKRCFSTSSCGQMGKNVGKYIERSLSFFQETIFLLLPNLLLSSLKTPLYSQQNSWQILGKANIHRERHFCTKCTWKGEQASTYVRKKGGGKSDIGNSEGRREFRHTQAHSTEYFICAKPCRDVAHHSYFYYFLRLSSLRCGSSTWGEGRGSSSATRSRTATPSWRRRSTGTLYSRWVGNSLGNILLWASGKLSPLELNWTFISF